MNESYRWEKGEPGVHRYVASNDQIVAYVDYYSIALEYKAFWGSWILGTYTTLQAAQKAIEKSALASKNEVQPQGQSDYSTSVGVIVDDKGDMKLQPLTAKEK